MIEIANVVQSIQPYLKVTKAFETFIRNVLTDAMVFCNGFTVKSVMSELIEIEPCGFLH